MGGGKVYGTLMLVEPILVIGKLVPPWRLGLDMLDGGCNVEALVVASSFLCIPTFYTVNIISFHKCCLVDDV
jgi:uncharacterized membrane protein